MSNLVIEVLSATVTTQPGRTGSYQVCELAFKNKTFQDKVEGKKIMSFAEKSAFETLKNATTGQIFTVVRQKDDKGYWKWVDVIQGENMAQTFIPAVGAGVTAPTAAKPTPKSTYETPEERAARQVMIVRQSSLSNAVNYLTLVGEKKATTEQVIDVAKKFEAYVMGVTVQSSMDSAISGLIGLEDDIPE